MMKQKGSVAMSKRAEVVRDTEDCTEDPILDLQLKMAASSINHEYARIEFDDTKDYERKEELLNFMHDCRCEYLSARSSLINHDPTALEQFELDLLRQKQTVAVEYYM